MFDSFDADENNDLHFVLNDEPEESEEETTVFEQVKHSEPVSPSKKTDKPASDTPNAQSELRPLPAEQLVLPVVPVREGVLFPSTESVLTFGRPLSVKAIQESAQSQNLVVLLTQRKVTTEEPGPNDLYEIGTLGVVERTLKTDDQVNALIRGIGRVKILRYIRTSPSLLAQVIKLEDETERDEELRALATHLQKEFRKAVHMGKPVEFLNFMKLMSGVTDGELVDQIASTLTIKTKDKQAILENINVKDRMKSVITHLTREMKVLEIEKDVVHKTQAKFDKHMRESVLRERLNTIRRELGEIDEDEKVVEEYEVKFKKTKFPVEVKDKVSKEIKRLRQMSVNNPESGYVRTWLDTVFELPWGHKSKANVNLRKASKVLEVNHYGLKEVKDRILEYMAVMQLKQAAQDTKARLPTILCFVGPPGVGKTSIGKSIAEALGRSFTKVSLGGIRDEAEIRGHRRTYVGAMPGRIINGIKQAKTMNPVFMLDEVDKVGADFRGDPSAALLEALDPEQNHAFEDHYLDLAFDLSDVIFITTANNLDTIPPALRDRLEIIRYPGYTPQEKFHIAKDHLLDKVLQANGLNSDKIAIPDLSIHELIDHYTREAGVRSLERTLGKLMRKAARQLAEADQAEEDQPTDTVTKAVPVTNTSPIPTNRPIIVDHQKIHDYLGPQPFDVTLAEADDLVGLATGLAWTEVGGDALFIEVALTPGKGQVKLTGKLGDVMKESAQAALTYVKANSKKLGISDTKLAKTDVHIHVPEGAVPKDGPSAGITITTAIVSAFTNRAVKREIAMTGEVTLRGRVLRIGGLKEKSIAALRAGSQMVIIPAENERDLVDIPDEVKKNIVFHPVKDVSEVLTLALKS
jgi:ATP-dependent Lon protease